MPSINYQGQKLEISDTGFYEHIIGLSYSTCSSVAIFGSLQYDGRDQSLTDIHLDHLAEVGQLIHDEILNLQFQEMTALFSKAQSMNDQLLEIFSDRADVPIPESQKDFQLLINKLEKIIDPNWYPLILSEKETSEVMGQINTISNDLLRIKEKMIRRIINLCSELKNSALIIEDDRKLFEG